MNRKERRKSRAIDKRKLIAKIRCPLCDKTNVIMSHEHFWPVWLYKRANISKGVKWIGGNYISPNSTKVPLCKVCNNKLGAELEEPISRIFDDLEGGIGISKNECELLIRWLWKFESLTFSLMFPESEYSTIYKPIERILGSGFSNIRNRLFLAISIISEDKNQEDLPIGIDSPCHGNNAVFVAGVFCNLAIMVGLIDFVELVPKEFSIFKFYELIGDNNLKIFFPKFGFETYGEAVMITKAYSRIIWKAHDDLFSQPISEHDVSIPRLIFPASYYKPF